MNFSNWLKDPEISFVKRQLRGTKRFKHTVIRNLTQGLGGSQLQLNTPPSPSTSPNGGSPLSCPVVPHRAPALLTKISFKSIRSIQKNNSTDRHCFLCCSRSCGIPC